MVLRDESGQRWTVGVLLQPQFLPRFVLSVDAFDIHIKGRGGHGAMPHETADPVIAAVGIVQAIQSIVSRNHKAIDDLVVSVTQIHAGSAHNVIPDTAYINGTVRTFDPQVQAMVMRRMAEIVAGQAASFGVEAVLDYQTGDPATVNDTALSRCRRGSCTDTETPCSATALRSASHRRREPDATTVSDRDPKSARPAAINAAVRPLRSSAAIQVMVLRLGATVSSAVSSTMRWWVSRTCCGG